jgi:predicted transcriptional regulator
MAIVRVTHDKENPFVVLSKSTVKDNSLSWDMLGLLVYLLAKPDNWQVRVDHLAAERGQHPATIYRLLRKLRDAGFVRRTDIVRRKPDGRFDQACLYDVFESRESAELLGPKVPF